MIASLFDYTGNWSKPYRDAGYDVEQIDIKHGGDVLTYTPSRRPWGVLAAPPCTIWTNAAAWMWLAVPPADFEYNLRLVKAAVQICRSAEAWWVLENPRGRLRKLRDCSCCGGECECPFILGPHVFEFQPADYGDAWTKRTCLWGVFDVPRPRRVLSEGSRVGGGHKAKEYPLFGARITNRGWDVMPKKFSKMTPADKERRREFRSATPPGFAQAFFNANP